MAPAARAPHHRGGRRIRAAHPRARRSLRPVDRRRAGRSAARTAACQAGAGDKHPHHQRILRCPSPCGPIGRAGGRLLRAHAGAGPRRRSRNRRDGARVRRRRDGSDRLAKPAGVAGDARLSVPLVSRSDDDGLRQCDRGGPAGNHLLSPRGRGDQGARPAPGPLRPPGRQPSPRPRLPHHPVMRIAIVAPLVTAIREPQLGGSQAIVADLATGLQSRGHEVHVYAASGSEIPGVTVIDSGVDASSLAGLLYRHGRLPASDARAADRAFATVYAAIRSGSNDVVHNHAFDPPAIRLASSLLAPVVHTLHLPPDPEMARALVESRGSDNPPIIAAVSASAAQAWRALASVDVILPDGVPVDRIPWSVTGGDGVIFAGRFSPEKGAEDAIAIAREAGVRIDLYGEPYDPDYAQSRVMSHQADAGVSIHGGLMRSELWRRMAEACAVICPAKWDEPFGMVAAEAQAAGTPVIAYRRGALPEIIIDGRTGFLVQPDDVAAAARTLKAISSIRREDCRRHAALDLNLDACLAAHEHLYQDSRPRPG